MKKFFKLMSESGGSSNSRVAMAIAFKRARHKFPKNFGAGENIENTNHSPDASIVENTKKPNNAEVPITLTSDTFNPEIDHLQSNLVDSFKQVEISDEIDDVPCEACQHESNNYVTMEEIRSMNEKEKFDNELEQQRPIDDSKNFKNYSETGQTILDDGNSWDERSYSFVWKEIPEENFDGVVIKSKSVASGLNDKSTNVTDSDMETRRIIEIPPRPHAQSRRRRSHRCSKRKEYQEERYSYSDDVRSTTNLNCAQVHHCHCHHRHCCCRIHCCYSRCCLNCQPRVTVSTPSSESSSSYRKSSSVSERRKEKCSICRKLRSSSPTGKSSSGHSHRNSGSRDSGIFTHVRYENEYEDEEEDEDGVDNGLKHKDSLSILQEKYKGTARKSEGRRRCDDEETSRSQKFCKRLLGRYETTY